MTHFGGLSGFEIGISEPALIIFDYAQGYTFGSPLGFPDLGSPLGYLPETGPQYRYTSGLPAASRESRGCSCEQDHYTLHMVVRRLQEVR